ncbi:MAG: type 2 isopentenyl-diphosphate Delta-isomerase [Rhizobiaceae bacterium]
MLEKRKIDHLDIVLNRRHATSTATTGLGLVNFVHCALPEVNLDDVDLHTDFAGKQISAPILISSMTGGPSKAKTINANIATVCQELNLPFGIGSQRIALEDGSSSGLDMDLRKYAPDVPILGNIGAAQLNQGYGKDEAVRAIEMIGADGLFIHLNPLQEAVQSEGDRNWSNLIEKIARLVSDLPVPVAVKEVGFGISDKTASDLVSAGVTIIDVAGAGGTNWASVEAARSEDPVRRRLGETFSDWGIPTAYAVAGARKACPQVTLIASGGIKNGVEIAKCIRIGADMAGIAAGVLQAAVESEEKLHSHISVVIEELRIACFCTGSKNLEALRQAPLLSAGDDVS